MSTHPFLAAILSVAFLAAGAGHASAQTYYGAGQNLGAPNEALNDPLCRSQRQNRAMIGGAIGAAVGAVLGNNLAARNAQTEGAALGGVVGAGAGALIGRNSASCNNAYRPGGVHYQGPPQPGYAAPVYRDAPVPTSGYPYPAPAAPVLAGGYEQGQTCRNAEIVTRDSYGRENRETAYLCQGADGVWRPAY